MPPKKIKAPKTSSRTDKVEEEEVPELAKLAPELITLANMEGDANPSAADIMQAIVNLQSSVDNKFTDISSKISTMQITLSSISGKVNDIEVAVNEHEVRMAELESLCNLLQQGQDKFYKKLDQLESYSRRQNIRILGVKEGAEKGKPMEFVSELIPTLLGNENFTSKLVVDRAHRSLGPKPADGGRPRPLIVRLHYYQTRERIVKLAAQKGPLRHDGAKVFIFPDLSPDVVARRKEFDTVRKRCREAGLRYGFLHPARFVVTVDGDTHTFDKPDVAMRLLDQKLPGHGQN